MWFSLPLGAWDGLRYFIVALPEPSIELFSIQIQKKDMGRTDFSDQFRDVLIRLKRIGYNLNVMRQSSCIVINPITIDNFAPLLNCTPMDRASISIQAST